MKRYLLILALILFSLSSQAAGIRYYDVEVIIFQYLKAHGYHSEHWPQQIDRKMPGDLIEIGGKWPSGKPEKYDPALSFIPLPESKWRLTAEAEKINHSKSRRLLAHLAWVQPGLPQDQALSVHFNLPVMATPETNKSGTPTTQNEPENPATKGPAEIGTLDALIRVSLARYLRVKTDLLLTLDPLPAEKNRTIADPERESEAEITPAPRYFRVQQVRRHIRSTELHYLDHPVLGMLIMFTQHKTAEKAAAKKR